jgi:hypothetical protein
MTRGLYVHPKYGLNPTLGICFWCGKEDGTIGLLGWNKGKEAPRHAICTLDPCPKCKANMDLGIVVIEATPYQQYAWQVEVQEKSFPTGRWCVIKRDASFWNCINEPMRSNVLKQGKCFFTPDLYEGFGFAPKMDEAKAS